MRKFRERTKVEINVDIILYPFMQMYYQQRDPLKLQDQNNELRETLLKLQKVPDLSILNELAAHG
jgi:hypothetical protein